MASEALELEPVTQLIVKLRSLLERARTIKPTVTLEPPLPIAELVKDVDALHDGFGDEEGYDQTYRFATIEIAARKIFYTLLNSADMNSPDLGEVWNLIDILLVCGDRGQCGPEVPCYLIEDLLDSQTIEGCRTVFDYLQSRRERVAQKDFYKKQLVFLRCCNELLRRLSRAEDAIFCGRIFFFLFQVFPLGDKSSVNLRGEFHVENATQFDLDPPSSEQNGDQMAVDVAPVKPETETPKAQALAQTPQAPTKPGAKPVPTKVTKDEPKTSDERVLDNSTLYSIFWSLQQNFSDPPRLFAASNFLDFKKGLTATITKFKKTPTVAQTNTAQRGIKRRLDSHGLTSSNGANSDSLADTYNPKYLTSRELFDLELADLAFQRHILVQALILIDFLLSLTEKAKKKLASIEPTNRSLLYGYTLSEDDTEWALSTRSSIRSELRETADGKFYERMVDTVLARDRNWVRWKIESCPSIVRDPVPTALELVARAGARSATKPRRIPEKTMDATDLSFLDEQARSAAGNLEALKDPRRYRAPTIEELISGMKADELDLELAMDDAEKASFANAIANKRWRVLRQARASRLDLLDKVDPGKDLDKVFATQVESADYGEGGGVVADDGARGDAPAVVLSQESGGNGARAALPDTPGPEPLAMDQSPAEPAIAP